MINPDVNQVVNSNHPPPTGNFPPYTSKLLLRSFLFGIIPPIVLILAIASKNLVILTYTHIMCGVLWTGFDIFMALIMGRILRSLDIGSRVEVVKRLTPSNFFILPSLAATTITAGIFLAMSLGVFNLTYYWIIFALTIVSILTIQGFGVFMPNSMRIFIELAKATPDRERIARLNGINIRLTGIQGALQIAIIFVMVNIANINDGTKQIDLPVLFLSLFIFALLFLAIYLLIYRNAYYNYKKGALDKGVMKTLNFGLYGHVTIFILLGIALAFA